VFRLTYSDIKMRQHELMREAASRRLVDSVKPREPGIWRFPRAFGLRLAALRPAV
jgi:hypothetical protein